MEVKVQITVKSEVGQPEVVREVARMERGSLRSKTLGLSLAGARAILGGLEKTMAERQTAEFVEQGRRCPPLWPGARVQRAPPIRVSHPVWQTTTG
jgi:hypothetical protein